MSIKKIIAGACVSAGMFALLATAVLAAGNSVSGIDRYMWNLGRQQATEVGAQCGSGAGSGAFGYFGTNLNLGIKYRPTDPGANGFQTGLNNSGVCGNRQGNLL
jgi:hypothetical protein